MREHKFRAWDKEFKEMLPMDLLKEEWFYNEQYWDCMQFTGLKDKNNKDIFEGDIIKVIYVTECDCGNKTSLDEYIGEVSWLTTKQARFGWLKNGNWKSFELDDHIIEIIGNIYENKDLLNK